MSKDKRHDSYAYEHGFWEGLLLYIRNPENNGTLFVIAFLMIMLGSKLIMPTLTYAAAAIMVWIFFHLSREEKKFTATFLVVLCSFRMFLFEHMVIPSGSMAPGLLVGDIPIVKKFEYGYTRHSLYFSPNIIRGRILSSKMPKRGDIIVFRQPRDEETYIVKRVIALEGERVRVTGGVIYINDKPVKQTFLGTQAFSYEQNGLDVVNRMYEEELGDKRYKVMYHRGSRETKHKNNTEEYTVPQGHYFVMGDNRDNSDDSRLSLGFVPADNIVGMPVRVLLSMGNDIGFFQPWRWLQNIRYERIWKKIV